LIFLLYLKKLMSRLFCLVGNKGQRKIHLSHWWVSIPKSAMLMNKVKTVRTYTSQSCGPKVF
jgi:hypothetical protein